MLIKEQYYSSKLHPYYLKITDYIKYFKYSIRQGKDTESIIHLFCIGQYYKCMLQFKHII